MLGPPFTQPAQIMPDLDHFHIHLSGNPEVVARLHGQRVKPANINRSANSNQVDFKIYRT